MSINLNIPKRHLNYNFHTSFMDVDEKSINQLQKDIEGLEWRLKAVEKEQRLLIEDILSGEPIERIKKRLLDNSSEDFEESMKKLDKQIKIRI